MTGDSPRAPDPESDPDPAAPSVTPQSPGSLGRRFSPDEGVCELCGYAQLDRHCKVVCPRCGFIRDCSDP